MERRMMESLQNFEINMMLIEGRHYAWPRVDSEFMNSQVIVEVDNLEKRSLVIKKSDNPIYNQNFVFEFRSSLKSLLDKNLTIRVIVKPKRMFGKNVELGFVTLDISTIWYQTDHRQAYKWVILRSPNDNFELIRGYLLLHINVLIKGQSLKMYPMPKLDDIKGNLLIPYGMTKARQLYFIVDVYRGIYLGKKHSIIPHMLRRRKTPSSSFVQVSYCGVKIKTSTKKRSALPIWNERFIIKEIYPPLCETLKIQVFRDCQKNIATRSIPLNGISLNKNKGFRPTFGPAFLHFYSPNPFEGYVGKILFALNNKYSLDVSQENIKSQIGQEANFFLKYEDVILFATIFEATMISRMFRSKAISFGLAWGSMDENNGSGSAVTVTPSMMPKMTNDKYWFVTIEENKPCLHQTLSLPDTRKRMYNCNLISKVVKELKWRINKIENHHHSEMESLLVEALDFMSSAATKYIKIASQYNFEAGPSLEETRLRLSLKEMENAQTLSKIQLTGQNKQKVFQKIQEICSNLETLIDFVEAWPHIYIWMIHGKKRVAYHITTATTVLHSPAEEEKGEYCGVLRTIYLQTDQVERVSDLVSAVCKMEIMMWIGLSRHLNNYLPSGFFFSFEVIPRRLLAEEKHEFQARAYILQAKLSPLADECAACSPFVWVVLRDQIRKTKVQTKTMTPTWNQTLVFQKIVFYGPRDFIRANPPNVMFEICDSSECYNGGMVGKTVLTPTIKTVEQLYVRPQLQWLDVCNEHQITGKINVAVEMMEIVQDSDQSHINLNVIPIPSEIKSTPGLDN